MSQRPEEVQSMSDKFVIVQMFNNSFEAQMAKNLLANEGIESMVSGELSQDVLLGTGLYQIALQVHADDAQRATGILAAVAAAKLDDNWEEQAEAGVWTCSICGEPVSNHLSVCYACQTPREGIRAGAPRDRTAIQPDPATLPMGEEVQKRDEIARTPSPAPAPLPPPTPAVHEPDEIEESSPTAIGDDLARHAFRASFFGLLIVLLLPLSWYYLARLLLLSGELSPKGMRYLYGALGINGFFILVAIVVCAGGFRY